MDSNYYFLAAALPDLQIGHPPDINFQTLLFLLKTNLTERDLCQSRVIQRYYDIQNMRAFWIGEEFDLRGYYNENELEEVLLTESGLPSYVYDFLGTYSELEDRLRYFSLLVGSYYRNEIDRAQGFLKEYLLFEREWKLVLLGFRAKMMGRDLAQELQFEDPYDELIAQMMAQKDAATYEPPLSYSDLKVLFEQHRDSPLELHKALCKYRFDKLESMYGVEVFSIRRILAYMAQLIIVEKWLELDKKKGLQVVQGILKEAS